MWGNAMHDPARLLLVPTSLPIYGNKCQMTQLAKSRIALIGASASGHAYKYASLIAVCGTLSAPDFAACASLRFYEYRRVCSAFLRVSLLWSCL